MIKLIGILIILIGFVLKFDTIAVVLVAGVTTGLVSGLSFNEILTIIGESFVNNRQVTIFLLTLPVIAILERKGLREQAGILIGKLKAATVGRVLWIYTVIRMGAAALGLRLGGHVQFIRPLVYPMAKGALGADAELSYEQDDLIKGNAASAENYGNFFGQNIFVAASGVLLIQGTLGELGVTVNPIDVAKASIPVGLIVLALAFIQFTLLDLRLKKGGQK